MAKENLGLNDVRLILGNRIAQQMRAPSIEFPHEPRDYQLETLDKIGGWLRSKKQERSCYVSLATGLGKTMIFSMLVALCKDLRVLIIVPNKTLVVQTVHRLQGYTQGLISQVSSLPSIKSDDNEVLAAHGAHHDVVVTTDESFKQKPWAFGKTHLIIWDECHWAYTDTAQQALDHFPESVVIGFSATPDFLSPEARHGFHEVVLDSGQRLYADPDRIANTYFGTRLIDHGPVWGITNGWLANLAWGRIDFNISLDHVPLTQTNAGLDYKEADLCTELQRNWGLMVGAICRMYKSGKPLNVIGRLAYAICANVSMAEQLAEELCKVGVNAICIHGKTPDEDRNRILAAYNCGEIDFISSVLVLREGWDAPGAEVCWMLRPTRSRVLYVQAMGRVLRKNDSSKTAIVIDPHFSGTRLAPLSTPQLFLPPISIRSGQVIIRSGKGVVSEEDEDVESPYLPHGVEPTITEVRAIEAVLLANDDWKTHEKWAEELGIAPGTVRTRLKSHPGELRRTSTNRVYPHYYRSVVMNVCADLINTENATGHDWKTAAAWAQELGIMPATVRARVKNQPKEQRRAANGNVCAHYHRSVVMNACADLLNTKQGDSDWKTVAEWAKALKVSGPTVSTRMADKPSEQRLTSTGQVWPHYHRTIVMRACADFLSIKDGNKDWKTIAGWAEELGVSTTPVSPRLKNQPNEQRRDAAGKKRPHYHRSVVMRVCADLLQTKNDDPDWKTSAQWAKELSMLSESAVMGRLRGKPNERRRSSTGFSVPHYHRSLVVKLFADVLNAKSGDENWKTPVQWAEELGIPTSTMRLRLVDAPSENRLSRGAPVTPHYHRSVVMKACADLIAQQKAKGKKKR